MQPPTAAAPVLSSSPDSFSTSALYDSVSQIDPAKATKKKKKKKKLFAGLMDDDEDHTAGMFDD